MDILKQEESVPVNFPGDPGVTNPPVIWPRIECYIAHRFFAREVVWIVEGVEDEPLHLPLTPIVAMTVEKWEGGAWVVVTLPAGPMGHILPSEGHFRIVAQVGAGPIPAAVWEACRRLSSYSAEVGQYSPSKGRAGATNASFDTAGVKFSLERQSNWAARAIQLSGAADLLRPYRRA